MNRIAVRMSAIVVCAALVVSLLAPVAVRAADPSATMKPVIVLSLASYDELHSDIDFLGQASGNPDLVSGIDGLIALGTQLQGLVGLDKSRPLGAAVRTDGVQFQMLAFVPVKSASQLLGALAGLVGQPEKIGDHTWRINSRVGAAFVREHNGWAFIAQLEEHLNDLPADPAALLAELPKHYDLAVRLYAQAIPAPLREMAIDQLTQKLAAGGKKRDPNAPKDQNATTWSPGAFKFDGHLLVDILTNLDELTVGYDLDPSGHGTRLDVSVTGVAGSPLATAAAAPPPPASPLPGFMLPSATLALELNRRLSPELVERNLAIVDSAKRALIDKLSEVLSTDEEKAKVSAWIEQTAAVFSESIRKGHTTAGLMANYATPVTIATGLALDEADRLENILRQAAKLLEQADHAPRVQLDVDKLQSVHFHRLSMPTDELITLADIEVPEVADMVRRALGDEAQLTLGFGHRCVFAALGPKGLETIKDVIEHPAAGPAGKDVPLQLRLAVAPIIGWWKGEAGNAMWAQVADEIGKAGKDHLLLTVRPISGGLRVRLEGEEGIVKVLGVRLKLMAVGGAPAGF